MGAYFSAPKKAAIVKLMRAPLKSNINTVLDEVALGIAHDIADMITLETSQNGNITAAAEAAISTAIEADGIIEAAIDAAAVPESDLSVALTAHFEAIRPDYAASNLAALGSTISNPPTQAEVQAIVDKLDALLFNLKSAGVMTPDA